MVSLSFSYFVNDDFTVEVVEDTSDFEQAESLQTCDTIREIEIPPEDNHDKNENLRPSETHIIEDDNSDDEHALVIHIPDEETPPGKEKSTNEVEEDKTNTSQFEDEQNAQKMWQCALCNYHTNSDVLFNEHTKQHNATFACSNCSYRTSTDLELQLHKAFCDTTRHKFKCSQCPFVGLKRSNLQRHIRNYHSEDPVYRCPECPFSTWRWSLVDGHKKLHDPNYKMYKCSLCDFHATKRSSLVEHTRVVHFFKCDKCSFQSGSKEIVEKHKKSHLVEIVKLPRCDVCMFEDASFEVVKKHRENHFKKIMEKKIEDVIMSALELV